MTVELTPYDLTRGRIVFRAKLSKRSCKRSNRKRQEPENESAGIGKTDVPQLQGCEA